MKKEAMTEKSQITEDDPTPMLDMKARRAIRKDRQEPGSSLRYPAKMISTFRCWSCGRILFIMSSSYDPAMDYDPADKGLHKDIYIRCSLRGKKGCGVHNKIRL